MKIETQIISVLIGCLFVGGGLFGSNNGKADIATKNAPVVPNGGNVSTLPTNDTPSLVEDNVVENGNINDTVEGATLHPAQNITMNGKSYPEIIGENDSIPSDYKTIYIYFDKLSENENKNLLLKMGAKKLCIYPKVIMASISPQSIQKLIKMGGISYLSVVNSDCSGFIGNNTASITPCEPAIDVINPKTLEFYSNETITSDMKLVGIVFDNTTDVYERKDIIQNVGGNNIMMYKGHELYSYVRAYIPADKINQLKANPKVLAASFSSTNISQCSQGVGWGVNSVEANNYQSIMRGDYSYNSMARPNDPNGGFKTERVSVAVIDSGCNYNHEDFTYNRFSGIATPPNPGNGLTQIFNNLDNNNNEFAVRGWDPYGDGNGHADSDPIPEAGSTHGTCCAGIIGMANNNVGYIGVAPTARLFAVRVGNDVNGMSETAIQAALGWVRDNRIDVVSMSFASFGYNSVDDTLCSQAKANGCTLVASSGNYYSIGGDHSVEYPAAYSSVIAVGAIDQNNVRCDIPAHDFGSCYGPELDFVAPGCIIYTTSGSGYVTNFEGTSAAAPFVAGVAALIKSQNPRYTPDQIENALRYSAMDLGALPSTPPPQSGTPVRDDEYGYGLIKVSLNSQIEAEEYNSGSGVDCIYRPSGGDPWEAIALYHQGDTVNYKFTYNPTPQSSYSNLGRLVVRATAGGVSGASGRLDAIFDNGLAYQIQLPSSGGVFKDLYTNTFDANYLTIGIHTLTLEFEELNGDWNVGIDRLWIEHTTSAEVENYYNKNGVDYVGKGFATGVDHSLFFSLYSQGDWVEVKYAMPPWNYPQMLYWKVIFSGIISVYSGTPTIKVNIDDTTVITLTNVNTGYYDVLTLGTFYGYSGTHRLSLWLYSEGTGNTDLHPSYLGIEIAS